MNITAAGPIESAATVPLVYNRQQDAMRRLPGSPAQRNGPALLAVSVAVAVCVVCLMAVMPAAQEPRFRTGITTIPVTVTVTDAAGRPAYIDDDHMSRAGAESLLAGPVHDAIWGKGTLAAAR